MADEDVTLNGKPLQSLRVADLKAALEQRCLPKSGAKNTLIKRLKGALMLENLQRTSTPHIGLQPNSQIGEEMSQNSFIKQYLAQQQELLRQRLEREAREAAEADESPAGPEEEEHTEEGNDSDSYHPDKHRPMPSQPPLTRAEEEGGGGGGPMMMGHQGQGMIMGQGMMSQGMGQGVTSRRPGSVPQESPDAPGGPGSWMQQRPSLQHGLHHEEPTTPSPPRAVASLSVRVLGDPERQGLPPSTPPRAQTQEKEGTAPADDDRPAHSVLHLSRSARAAAAGNRGQEDCGDDDSSEEDEDEWGPVAGVRRGGGSGCAPPPQPQQPSPSVPAARERSRRKLQPPQHIPPQQVAHQPPMQLRQPTPPPSPPPELSFPLPDTPKQSPPDMDEEPEGAGAGVGVRPPPGGLQRQDSDSSSRSSSPEPLAQRRPGPLSLLARKMASEGAFGKRGEGAQADGQTGPGGEVSGPGDGVGSSPGAGAGPGVGVVKFPGAAITHIGGSSSTRHTGLVTVPEVPAPGVMFGSGAQSHPLPLLSVAAVPSITLTTEPQGPSGETVQKRTEKEKEIKQEEERKQEEKEDEREEERKQEEKEREEEMERKIKQEEEKERKMKEEEMERKQEEERKMKQEEKERKQEEERKMKQEEKERKQEEERRMKKQEEERKMKQEEKERERKQEEKERKQEEVRKKKEEEERKMRQEEERKMRQEEERKMKEEEVRKQQEERKRKQEEKERKQQEEERKRKQQQEEERKMKEEEKERKMKQEEKDRKQEEKEREMKKKKEEKEREEKKMKEEKERKMKQQEEEKERKMKQEEKERESHLPPWQRGRDLTLPSASSHFESGGSEEPTMDQGDTPKKSPFGRDEPSSSAPGSAMTTTSPPAISPKKPRMFSDTSSGSMTSPPKPEQQGSVVVTTPGEPPEPHGISVRPQVVLVSGAQQHTDDTMEVTALNKASVEKPGWKTGGEDGKMEKESDSQAEKERDSQVEKGTAKAWETRRRGPEETVEVEPMGPVLPPSYPGKEEEERRRKEDERKRKEDKRKEDERKKEEERGRQGQRVRHRRSTPSSGGDSSSSDSGSSSSRSSGSTSSRDKKKKKTGKGKGWGDEKTRLDKGGEKKQPAREVKQSSLSEPSGPMEVERPDLGQTQPTPVGDPQNCEGHMEESTTPKAFAARKISLTTGSKTSPEGGAAGGEAECGTAAGRKRRWGSSTAVNAKKPSISITTDSLKSLIPDIKPNQEAVVDLHPDDIQLSEDEDTTTTRDTREDQGLDKGLKIRRTVTQVVPGENQENGQGEREEEEEEEEEKKKQECDKERTQKERKNSYSEDAMESQSSTTHDADAKKVTPSDTLVRRSISQQKSGVSVTIDDPVRTAKQPSPPRGKVSNIVHVCNLVRPFTLGQLKELLNRTGSVVEDGFWIDKIKSHCYVTYSSTEEAVATRAALHGVKWPQSNPKVLSVDFCEQNELDFHRGLLTVDPREEHRPQPGVGPGGPKVRPGALPPLMDGRGDRGVVGGVRDQWAEREREMERRERTRAEREWDRDKVRDFGGKPGEERERGRRSRSLDRERRRKERDGKEKKSDKKDEPPAKLLDDLFNKTKAAPCIYWLPLTEEQATQRGKEREERQKERERRRKEQQEEEDKKREEERKERIKSREKEGGAAVSTGSVSVRGSEGDRERERERGRDREGDKRRDSGGFRPRGPDIKPSAGLRRSRSRSNPRDRRR